MNDPNFHNKYSIFQTVNFYKSIACLVDKEIHDDWKLHRVERNGFIRLFVYHIKRVLIEILV